MTKKLTLIKYAAFGSVFLLSAGIAQASGLTVVFENDPLFNEANFLPGDNVSRWVQAANSSGETKSMAAEAIYVSDPDGLADVLNLEIKEGQQVLYDGTLAGFFDAGEVYLSELADGGQTQYDFTVSFAPGAENEYQGKSLGFDILVGFQGEIAVSGGTPPGGGGGGGPSGLIIFDETFQQIDEDSVMISWHTSYRATSRVIYAREDEPHAFDWSDQGGPLPLYGYARTSDEYHVPAVLNGVTYREIFLHNLTPGYTYYFRCISHASPDTVSREFSFVVEVPEQQGEGSRETGGDEETGGGTDEYAYMGYDEGGTDETGGERTPGDESGGTGERDSTSETGGQESGGAAVEETIGGADEFIDVTAAAGKSASSFFDNLSAGLLALIGGLGWWLILLIFPLLLFFLLSRRRKKKEEDEQQQQMGK